MTNLAIEGRDMKTVSAVVDVNGFNALSDDSAVSLLQSCLAVPSWVDELLAGRPYRRDSDLLTQGRLSASALSADQIQSALARHPRIGEAAGVGHDAEFSEREQSGFDQEDSRLVAAMHRGNLDYESRFGRVFLIRAAGRTADEILAELQRRLANTPEEELSEVVRELGEIAVLRLGQLVQDNTASQRRQS